MSDSSESFNTSVSETHDQLIELRVRTTDGEFQSHELRGELVVGRDSRCDVVILDPFLSRRHARLYRQGQAVICQDMSRNGTRVNGELIEIPTPIAPGDLIEVHGHRIELATDRDLSSAHGAIYRPADELRQTESGVRVLPNDADDLREAVERLRRVTEIYEALARFNSKEQLLPRVLQHAFEVFDADVGDIFLQTDHSGYVRAANRCKSAAVEPSPFSRSLLKRVCDEGLAVVVPDVFQDPHLTGDSMVGIESRSIAAAPIAIEEATLGMLVLGSRRPHAFAESDLGFLATLASIAAIKLHNVRLGEERARKQEEEELARRLQESLLPPELQTIEGFEVYASNEPSLVVSGDYYGLVMRPQGRALLAVADASGKGMAAALLTASLDAMLEGPAEDGLALTDLCTRLCRRIWKRTPPERYATAAMVDLDPATGAYDYINAGHNPTLLLRVSGEVERLGSTGIPLGMFAEGRYESVQGRLDEGDLIFLYTDGVIEVEDRQGEEFGLQRLQELVHELRQEQLPVIAERVSDRLRSWSDGAGQSDDVTMLLVRRAT